MKDIVVGNVTFSIVASKRNDEILYLNVQEQDAKKSVQLKLTRMQLKSLGEVFIAASGKE